MSNDLISREYIKLFICEYEKFNGKETEIVKAIPIQAIDNAPTVDITEEQAIDKLHETGWMQKHDKEMTERPTGKDWVLEKQIKNSVYGEMKENNHEDQETT